jgi:hypothetical protein
VGQLGNADRVACRAGVEQFFSVVAVTDAYLAVYAEMLSARKGRRTA